VRSRKWKTPELHPGYSEPFDGLHPWEGGEKMMTNFVDEEWRLGDLPRCSSR
jgi:hypothetical protein